MNNTQIEKILRDYNVSTNNAYINAEQDWKNMLSDIDSYIQENYVSKDTLEEMKLEVSLVIGNRSLDRTMAPILMEVGSIFDRHLSKTQEEGGKQE